MKVFTVLIATLCFTGTAYAQNNIPASAYGKWGNVNAHYVISKQGIDEVNESARSAKKVEGYRGCKAEYSTTKVSGKKLRTEIRESVKGLEEPNAAYEQEMTKIYSLIKPNQIYLELSGWTSCGDGSVGFIQITDTLGLRIDSAPEDYYSVIYKD